MMWLAAHIIFSLLAKMTVKIEMTVRMSADRQRACHHHRVASANATAVNARTPMIEMKYASR